MAYRVKEVFYSLQGEGVRAGRPAVFCRFAGCNLWSGRQADRAASICRFCDTDFVDTDGQGGGVYAAAEDLVPVIAGLLPAFGHGRYRPYVVFTGGEPALQLDEALLNAARTLGAELAVETNGTLPLPAGLDWVTVSPKAGARLAVTSGDELKLVWPQEGLRPEDFESLDFRHFCLQPRHGADARENVRITSQVVTLCLERPVWRLSLQMHKLLGIP